MDWDSYFMSYQRISKSVLNLEFLEANSTNFFQENTGLDPIIGRLGWEPPPQKWPAAWGTARARQRSCSFGGFVTLKGGEYFFAPNMSFLKKL